MSLAKAKCDEKKDGGLWSALPQKTLRHRPSVVSMVGQRRSGVHLSVVLENTAVVQGIRCEPLGEHLIPWTCALFFHTARK